jgi:ABC transport system ATP-binding/permease protein
MLEVLNLSHQWQRKGSDVNALDGVHFSLPGGHLAGVLGAVGSGKSTLLLLLCGVENVQSGGLHWEGGEFTKYGLPAGSVAWLSADEETVWPHLNVKEHVVSAILLRVDGASRRDAVIKADKLLVLCGLDGMGGQRAGALTVAQKKRLLMAMALASDPVLVICDAFTSGVDPRVERELGALLQQVAAAHPRRVVLNGTSSLAELDTYDSVIVLHEGRVCFHGPGRALTHYFSIPHTEDLYHRLAKRPAERWQDSWDRHCDSYYDAFKLLGGQGGGEAGLRAAEDEGGKRLTLSARKSDDGKHDPVPDEAPRQRPSFATQLQVLLMRRWMLFRRRKSDLWVQAAMVVCLPLLIIMLVGARSAELTNWPLRLAESPVSGFIISMTFFLEVVLLMAAAAWTVSREAVEGRTAWPSEHVGGLRSSAWITAKLLFISVLLLAQALSMAMLTELVVGAMPGHGGWRALLLAATSLGFGWLCMGLGAWARTLDQARFYGAALLILNLLASGALLAWPRGLALMLQSFLTAYYGWSGSLQTLSGSPWMNGVTALNNTALAGPGVAMTFLLTHALLGAGLLVAAVRRRR